MLGKPETFGAKFGALVKERREAQGLSLANLALQVFGTNPDKPDDYGDGRKRDVKRLEDGETANPRTRTVRLYAKALGITQAEIDALRASSPDPQAHRIRDLETKLAEMHEAAEARASGVSEKALRRLVRPIAEEVDSVADAVLALQEAVEIAARVQRQGHHGSNLGAFVDEVLGRVAALSAEGEHETAIDAIDAAMAAKEAEHQAGMTRLLTAAIDQHLLAFDADGAAARIVQRVAMETPDPAARFDALRAERQTWLERGRDKGLNLDLRVAIALAEASHRIAATDGQRGAALDDLGTALATLGEREQGTDRLEQAVAAYEAATTVTTRDALPLDWAMTQNNLGTALQTLGEREQDTARLEQAVAAYEAALTIQTRDATPLDWAGTQNNLGNALQTLGAREQGTARLEQAVAAYEAALTIYTSDATPLDWATTMNNLGNALQTLGAREQGPARLEQAFAAYEAALTVYTSGDLPFPWARTRENMALAHLALFQKTGDRAQLDLAKAAVAEALEVYTAAGATYDIGTATRLRARLDTL